MSYPSIGPAYFENDFFVWTTVGAGAFSTTNPEIVSNEREPEWVNEPFFGGIILKQGSALWFNLNHMPNHVVFKSIARFKLCLNTKSRIKVGLLKHEIFNRTDEVVFSSSLVSRDADEWFFSEYEFPLGVQGGTIVEVAACINANEFILSVNGEERVISRISLVEDTRYAFTIHTEEGEVLIDYASMSPVNGLNPVVAGTDVSASRPQFRTFIYPKDFIANLTKRVFKPRTSHGISVEKLIADGEIIAFPISVGDRFAVLGQTPGQFQSAHFQVVTTKEIKPNERFRFISSVSFIPGDITYSNSTNQNSVVRGSEVYNRAIANTSTVYFNIQLLELPESWKTKWHDEDHIEITANVSFGP